MTEYDKGTLPYTTARIVFAIAFSNPVHLAGYLAQTADPPGRWRDCCGLGTRNALVPASAHGGMPRAANTPVTSRPRQLAVSCPTRMVEHSGPAPLPGRAHLRFPLWGNYSPPLLSYI